MKNIDNNVIIERIYRNGRFGWHGRQLSDQSVSYIRSKYKKTNIIEYSIYLAIYVILAGISMYSHMYVMLLVYSFVAIFMALHIAICVESPDIDFDFDLTLGHRVTFVCLIIAYALLIFYPPHSGA